MWSSGSGAWDSGEWRLFIYLLIIMIVLLHWILNRVTKKHNKILNELKRLVSFHNWVELLNKRIEKSKKKKTNK